jgi:phage/plasmid-associated DNA primase
VARSAASARAARTSLSGILNLALKGLARLRKHKGFRQPATGLDLIGAAEELASPVAQCVKACFHEGPGRTVATDRAFEIWRAWAYRNNYPVGNPGTFGKNLRASCPGVKRVRRRDDSDKDKQIPTYEGLEENLVVTDQLLHHGRIKEA